MTSSKNLIEMLNSANAETVREAALEMWSRFCTANGYGCKFANRTAQKIINAVCPEIRGEKDCGIVVYRLAYISSDLKQAADLS